MVRRRKVGPNNRSYTGRHVTGDGENTVRYESKLERDLLILLESRPGVLEITEQPFTLEFVDSTGRKKTYTPDFLVRYADKTSIYEVKFKDELKKNWDRYREPYFYARSWAKQNGMRFRIMTEKAIRTLRTENFRVLRPFLRVEPDADTVQQILNGLAEGPWTIGRLAKDLYPNVEERGLFWQAMWVLLVQGRLTGDFDRFPLGMDFVVWRT
ncbi:TnsA endonuclease N-terminal domain-containing protein [Nitrospirillum pindoramense]|uniref:TnsA endonuclease-like protein n=1 Tax=Nitrospirillum amazonense TaxID=28077 RepID=A0A560GSA8_9PROT|nr:TnsA endonuclease N-terminal domain-containing protein [Nitrospirillum amazonense]TWB36918.1 TnsA endonuclease-like protein [Nitrospirillum amazonense]